jgi:hypothetical protein
MFPLQSSSSFQAIGCISVVYNLLFYYSVARCNKYKRLAMMKYELVLMMNKIRNEKERIIGRDHVSRQLIMSLSSSEVRRNLTYEQFEEKCIRPYISYDN